MILRGAARSGMSVCGWARRSGRQWVRRRRSAIGHGTWGDPHFGAFLTLFRLKFLYREHFEYAFLLSVYWNAEEAEMETLKLDGSREVLNCNLLKLPPGKSD